MGRVIVLMAATLGCAALIPAARAAGPQNQPLSLSLTPPSLDAGQTPQTLAQNATPGTVTEPMAAPTGGVSGYFANWFNRVEQAQASQPHWMTPIVTVTPRLEQDTGTISIGKTRAMAAF